MKLLLIHKVNLKLILIKFQEINHFILLVTRKEMDMRWEVLKNINIF